MVDNTIKFKIEFKDGETIEISSESEKIFEICHPNDLAIKMLSICDHIEFKYYIEHKKAIFEVVR